MNDPELTAPKARGGWASSLPAKRQEAIASQVPGVPLGLINAMASRYQTERSERPVSPAEARAELVSVQDAAVELYERLGALSQEAKAELSAKAGDRGPNLFEDVDFLMQLLMGAGRDAADEFDPKPGRAPSAKTNLIRNLAELLRGHGLEANARPTGDLCFLTGQVLESVGDGSPDVASLVKSALNGRETMPAK
jgi:hypothetical protein